MQKIILLVAISILLTGCSIIPAKLAQPQQKQSPQSQSQSQAQSTNQAPTQVPAQSPQTQTVSETNLAQWVDLKDDKVGPTQVTPDGKPDGHIHLTLAFPEEAKIKYIILRYQGFGEHIQWEWVYNTSLQSVGAPIGVFMNDKQVQQGTDVGLEVPAASQLDLYVPELNNENGFGTFKFDKGQVLKIQLIAITSTGKSIAQEADVSVNF